MKKPELLAPAGSLNKLITAFMYGADAVYAGGEEFSLRTAAENFSSEDLKLGIEHAHALGKKVYVAANIIPHNRDIKRMAEFVREASGYNADAVIVADIGALRAVKRAAPDIKVHVSTQANILNYETACFFHEYGASRVVLARELSLEEIREIRDNTPKELELEAFVHGAMCISYSGRCLLSNYMIGRDANMGDCAQSCRWKYSLVEEKRPNEYYPVFESDRGSFIFNSKDLCMIGHIPELISAGLDSFKIEGRVKSEYYVASTVKAYRNAIDGSISENSKLLQQAFEEVNKVSHREYYTGFNFDKPDKDGQIYQTSSYVRDYILCGIVLDYDVESKTVTIEQRNRFFDGEQMEILNPELPNVIFTAQDMRDTEGNRITSAPHPRMIVKMRLDISVQKGGFLRKKRIRTQ